MTLNRDRLTRECFAHTQPLQFEYMLNFLFQNLKKVKKEELIGSFGLVLWNILQLSLTLVTSFFETSKLWACIIYALEGLECLGLG